MPSETRSSGRNVGITEFRRKAAIDDRSGEGKLSTKNTAKHLLGRRIILEIKQNDSVAKAHQVSLSQKYRRWLPQEVVSSLGNAMVFPEISTLSVSGGSESSPKESVKISLANWGGTKNRRLARSLRYRSSWGLQRRARNL